MEKAHATRQRKRPRQHRQYAAGRIAQGGAGRVRAGFCKIGMGQPNRQHERPDGCGGGPQCRGRRSVATRWHGRRIHRGHDGHLAGAGLRVQGLRPGDRVFGRLQRREAPHHAGLRRAHHGRAERQAADHRGADQSHDRQGRRDQPPTRALVLRSAQQPRRDPRVPAARGRNLAPDPRRGGRFRTFRQHGALDPRRDAGTVGARSNNPGGRG